jgi:hypothetical protein
MEHLYADKSFTHLFSSRNPIDSFASANELYMVFLHGDSIGFIFLMREGLYFTWIIIYRNYS